MARAKTRCSITIPGTASSNARPCRAWACAALPICRSHVDRWCQAQPLAAVMASTRIGALTVGSLRNKIWIAFGMEFFGHAWLEAGDAYVIADWLESKGRAHGATILRAMLGEKVTVAGGAWAEPAPTRQGNRRAPRSVGAP